MSNAAFSISNYKFSKVELNLTNYVSDVNLDVNIEPKGKLIDEYNFQLDFEISITCVGLDNPYCKVECNALFEFSELITIDSVPEYFYTNSIAILFPYVRAYISIISSQANLPGIILPVYNLSHLAPKLRSNTL